jgi:hypothetical protein
MAPTESDPINVFMVAPHERRDAIPAPYQQSSNSRCVRNQMRWTLPACCARRPRRRTAKQSDELAPPPVDMGLPPVWEGNHKPAHELTTY